MSLIAQPVVHAQGESLRFGVVSGAMGRPAESSKAGALLDSLLAAHVDRSRLVHVPFKDVQLVISENTYDPPSREPNWSVGDLSSLGKLLRMALLVDLRLSEDSRGVKACARIVLVQEGAVGDSLCSMTTPTVTGAVLDLAPRLQLALHSRAKGLKPASPQPPPVDQATVYFEFQVGKPAMLASDSPWPVYPEILRRAGIEGDALVQFIVDTTGQVEEASLKVFKASHELFARAVDSALPGLRFVPAEIRGMKVRRVVQTLFVFSPPGVVTSPLLNPTRDAQQRKTPVIREISEPSSVPTTAPRTPPWTLMDPARIIQPESLGVPVFADLIEVEFREGTSLAERSAAVASVAGKVVGGFESAIAGQEGIYSVLLPHDSTGVLMLRAIRSLRARPSVRQARYEWVVQGATSVPSRIKPPGSPR